jgi:hypothetical protein
MLMLKTPKGKRPLGGSRNTRRSESNIKMYLNEIWLGWYELDSFGSGLAFWNMVTNYRIV